MFHKCYILDKHKKEISSEIITNRCTLACFRPFLELKKYPFCPDPSIREICYFTATVCQGNRVQKAPSSEQISTSLESVDQYRQILVQFSFSFPKANDILPPLKHISPCLDSKMVRLEWGSRLNNSVHGSLWQIENKLVVPLHLHIAFVPISCFFFPNRYPYQCFH